MQILERQKDIEKTFPLGWLDQVEKSCRECNDRFGNSSNLRDEDVTLFQDDSGI